MASKHHITVLKKRSDFDLLRNKGRTMQINTWLMVSFMKNTSGCLRVGWTLPSYVGTAVVRNRFKRWMREHFRRNSDSISQLDVDVNLVLKKRDPNFYRQLKHEELNAALDMVIKKISPKKN